MATNKHAQIRYLALDKCFSNTGRNYSSNDLLEACNQTLQDHYGGEVEIKKRQLYADITFMESEAGWSIDLTKKKEGRNVYYQYTDPSFSINQQPLNQFEKEQLQETLLTLTRMKGMPQFEWMEEMIARLDDSVSDHNTDQAIISFQQNPYLVGLDHFAIIYAAIKNKQVLDITYQKFNSKDKIQIELHPYHLKQYNNRWFLFGQTEEYLSLTNLPLDRIVSLHTSKKIYIHNQNTDFSEYFEDVIGVTISSDEKLEEISIWVSDNLFPYLKTKPLHGSQKHERLDDGNYMIYLKLIPNFEFRATILSHGSGLKIVSPTKLSKEIKTKISEMSTLYC